MKTLYRAASVILIAGCWALLTAGGSLNQAIEDSSGQEMVDNDQEMVDNDQEMAESDQEIEGNTVVFEKIDDLLNQGENQQAWEILQRLPENGPDSAERLWRMARVQYEMAQVAEKKSVKRYKSAEKYARAAIKNDPNNSESYKWLAIALGAQSKYSGTKEQVRQSGEIKKYIEKAIELNPDDDISYLVLSRWHYKVSALGGVARTFAKVIYGGVPKASLKKAEELLLQAIEIHDRIAHRYNLAKVYKRMDRQEEAMEQLRLTLLLPVTFPEEVSDKEKAKRKQQSWK
jgi:tetratricopeptide (TPR) repeat protein